MTSTVLVCNQCGHVGNAQSVKKGSTGVEVILWLCFLIPGLLYSVWRSSSRHPICSKCQSTTLIPSDSPKAHKLMSENMSEEEISQAIKTATEESFKETKRKNYINIAIATAIILVITLIFK